MDDGERRPSATFALRYRIDHLDGNRIEPVVGKVREDVVPEPPEKIGLAPLAQSATSAASLLALGVAEPALLLGTLPANVAPGEHRAVRGGGRSGHP